MAVNYYKGFSGLIEDLNRNQLHPLVLKRSGERRVLAAEIAVMGGLVVHWDRDSRSLWTEGPWPDAARLESRLHRLCQRNLLQRAARRPKTAIGVLVALGVVCGGYFISAESRSNVGENNVPSPALIESKNVQASESR